MSQEETVSHNEDSSEEEEEQEWSRALILEYEINDREVIHKIKLHEKIYHLEKKVKHLNKLLDIYKLAFSSMDLSENGVLFTS